MRLLLLRLDALVGCLVFSPKKPEIEKLQRFYPSIYILQA